MNMLNSINISEESGENTNNENKNNQERCPLYMKLLFYFVEGVTERCSLKLVSAIFYQIFIFSANDNPSKTVKSVFYFI